MLHKRLLVHSQIGLLDLDPTFVLILLPQPMQSGVDPINLPLLQRWVDRCKIRPYRLNEDRKRCVHDVDMSTRFERELEKNDFQWWLSKVGLMGEIQMDSYG